MSDDSIRGPSSSELLDLVRSAEEEARLPLRRRTPAVGTPVSPAPGQPDRARDEQVVEVGDEAIDVPPSRPLPQTAATRTARSEGEANAGGLRPAIAVPLLFALVTVVLALLAR